MKKNALDDGETIAVTLNNDVEWNEVIDCLFPDYDDLRSECDTCELKRDSNKLQNYKVFHGSFFTESEYNWKKEMLHRYLSEL
jgi:hypothetical protein